MLAAAVPRPEKLRIDAAQLFRRMMQAATTPHACMLEAIARLRQLGFKVGALTNNFQVPEDDESLAKVGGATSTMLPQIFDDFVESSVVGMRKPDPKVFQLALDRLGVLAHQTAFLDDLGVYAAVRQAAPPPCCAAVLTSSRDDGVWARRAFFDTCAQERQGRTPARNAHDPRRAQPVQGGPVGAGTPPQRDFDYGPPAGSAPVTTHDICIMRQRRADGRQVCGRRRA